MWASGKARRAACKYGLNFSGLINGKRLVFSTGSIKSWRLRGKELLRHDALWNNPGRYRHPH